MPQHTSGCEMRSLLTLYSLLSLLGIYVLNENESPKLRNAEETRPSRAFRRTEMTEMKIVQILNQSQQGHQQGGEQRGSDEASRSLEGRNGRGGVRSRAGVASYGGGAGDSGGLAGHSWGLGDDGDDLSAWGGQYDSNVARSRRAGLGSGSLSGSSSWSSLGGGAGSGSLGDWTPGDVGGDFSPNFGGGPAVGGRGHGGVALVFVA